MRDSGGCQTAQVDHGAFIPHWHPGPHSEGAGEELDNQRLQLEDVLYLGSVEKADNFWNAGARCGRLVEDEGAARHHEYDGVAHCEGEGAHKVLLLKKKNIWSISVFLRHGKLLQYFLVAKTFS